MPLYVFYTTVQKSQKWPKTQIKGVLPKANAGKLGHVVNDFRLDVFRQHVLRDASLLCCVENYIGAKTNFCYWCSEDVGSYKSLRNSVTLTVTSRGCPAPRFICQTLCRHLSFVARQPVTSVTCEGDHTLVHECVAMAITVGWSSNVRSVAWDYWWRKTRKTGLKFWKELVCHLSYHRINF